MWPSRLQVARPDQSDKASFTLDRQPDQAVHARMCMQDDHVLVFDRAGRLVDIASRMGTARTLSLS
jgi:hypothetical protein